MTKKKREIADSPMTISGRARKNTKKTAENVDGNSKGEKGRK